jgi:hypothetical protein
MGEIKVKETEHREILPQNKQISQKEKIERVYGKKCQEIKLSL